MAEAHESVTEVDDDERKDKGRRRRFGLGRKEDPKEVRSETEWVDTLVAHPEGDDAPIAGSPLAAGEEEEESPGLPEVYEAAPVREGEGELPEDVAEVGDEYLIREKQLYRPEKLSLENRVRSAHAHKGDRDAFYEKSWTRRTSESHDEIRNFVDNVLGTELDPSRRRERRERAGLPRRAPEQGGAATVHVEGLGRDVLIAFTFPKEEFRSARVVYETEGGYVVEVARAVGNDDARLETQYYTVSRIGEVGHVLDKMRAHEAERRAREQGVEPVAPVGGPEPEEAEALSDAPPQAPPTSEEVGVPEAQAEAQQGLTEADREPEAASPETEEAEGSKKGFGGLFKRKKEDEAGPDEAEPAPEPTEGAESEEGGKRKGLGGLFKRKKGDEEGGPEAPQEGEGTDAEENQA